ncbi:MAG TPA: SDR family NAD(P)-dependent oxidoreductase [Solirubrobacteraceae bacterium]|nr:SDR family NAD(P)-dependent oxidoreductase [Solirubrobacteraceae bacterium]
MDLTGATCLVTGANRGIGAALAARLAREPLATLLLGMRSPGDARPPAATPGGAAEVRAVRVDLGSRAAIDDSWAELDGEPIDLLINNAGQMTGGLLEEQDMERMYAMFQVNLVGVAHLTARVLPGMLARRRGKIVNNASISGYAHFPAATTYAASKAGVVALTESLRRELRGTGVDVMHLITPGVATEMLDDTESVYGRYMDTSGWERQEPGAWAEKVVAAIRTDARKLEPGGKIGWAVRAARGPAVLLDRASARMFSRQPRR